MLCYRIEAVGDEFEYLYTRYQGKIFRLALESRSENFHKRFHRFSLRRWMIFDLIISELPQRTLNISSLPYTEIDSQDLAKIMMRWRELCGFRYTPVSSEDFEDI